MSRTITSSSLTFLDNTDNRKVDVYITSNLPTSQIYNTNTKTYTPDWNTMNLQLSVEVFLDSEDISDDTKTLITWYEKVGASTETQIGTGTSLIITTNKMSNDANMITYICKATYQTMTAQSQLTFVRTDTGLNGADGTSVDFRGTAYYNGTLTENSVGQKVTLYADEKFTIPLDAAQMETGDAYIVQGYLCVYDLSKDAFICTGTIQGPPGESAKNIILNGNAQAFKINKDNTIFPSTISVTAQEINITVSDWSYSVNGGKTFLSTEPNGIVRNGSTVTITGTDMTENMIVIKALNGLYSDTYTIYKVFDGEQGNAAPIAFLTNENIAFSADSQGRVSATTVMTNVAAYNGTNKVIPTIGTITGIPEGMIIDTENAMILNDELVLSIMIDSNATFGSSLSTSGTISIPITSPLNTVLSLTWSKINTGATGADGADAVTFQVYSANGYVLSNDNPLVTLQTFSYIGDSPIEAGATYKWFYANDNEWEQLTQEVTEEVVDETTGETTNITTTVPVNTPYVDIIHTDVSFSCSYMCQMTFNGMDYIDVVTVEDKNDTNEIFTSKPNSYDVGDIWIVGNDYAPDGVEVGTVLKAQHTNTSYADEDWVTATKYDDKLSHIEADVNNYKQYISLDVNEGIRMNAIDENGNMSEFSTTLSNTQLSFNQADEAVAYINNHKMHITEAEIESPLTVTGKYSGSTMLQAPTINLGSFSFVVESNGSLSIISNL
jgi:hypothetical protein